MDYFFSVLLEIYPSRLATTKPSWMSLLIQFLLSFIVYLQNIQFLWYSKIKIPYWDRYEAFWMVVSAPGISLIVDYFGFSLEFVYTTLSTLLGLAFLLCILSAFKFTNKASSPFLCILTKILFEIVSNLGFIPIFLLLFRIYLNLEDSNKRNEYGSSLDFGSTGRILAVLGMIFVGFMTILYEGCHFETRPHEEEDFMNSKIDSKIDLCIKLVQIINCLLINLLSKSHQEKILLADMIMFGFCGTMLIIKMPYYSKYLLFFKTFFQISLAFTSLFFLIGFREQNAAVILVLFIIMQPLIGLLTYSLIEYRLKKTRNKKVSATKKFSSFELLIRPRLRTGDDKSILKKLNKNYILSKDRKNRIITAYYCNDILNNCSLGFNKISSITHKGFNIPLNYQIFKCKQYFLKLNQEFSINYKLNKYIDALIDIKEKDRDFCLDYFRFFTVLLKKNQSLENLKNSVLNLMNKFDILEKLYIKETVKYNNSKELKEMYGSFLCSIKGDTGLGEDILGYNWKIAGSQMNNFNTLIKDKMLFMISAEPKCFGKVKFMNREFSLFFEYNHLPCDDLYIWSLFPSDFRRYHENKLFQFADQSVTTVLYEKTVVFLLDSGGCIHECIIRAECIVLNGFSSFIFTVDPLYKNREYLQISDQGIIIGHSLSFSKTINISKKSVCGFFLQEILPELCLEKIINGNSNNFFILTNENKQKKVIFKKISILGLFVNILYFTDDFDINGDEDDFFFISEIDTDSAIDLNEMNIQYRPESEIFEEISRKLDIKENKSKFSNHSSSTPMLNFQEINCFKKSIMLMNVSKVILFILVNNIQVLSLIVSNVGTLVYLSIEIDSSISSSAIKSLNYISNGLAQSALILRSFDIYNHILQPQYFSEEYLDDKINQIKLYQDKIDEDLATWKYCSASSIVTDEILSYYDIKNVKEVRKANLFDFIEFILENVRNMQEKIVREKMNKGKNYNKELMNVVFNTLYGPLEQISNGIDQLVECGVNRANQMENQKTYILLTGVVVLIISVVIIFFYFICSDKHLDSLWEHLRIKGLTQGVDLKRKIKARISEYHASDCESIKGESKSLGKNSKKFSFRHSFRFFYKFSPLFLLAVLFLLLTTLLFYDQLKEYLYYRPYVVAAFPIRRVQMSVISFLIQESYATNNNYSIEQISSDFYPLPDIKNLLDEKITKIKLTEKYINDKKAKVLMSDYLYNRIFYKTLEGSSFLRVGESTGLEFLSSEAIFFILNNKNQTFSEVESLIDKMIEYDAVANEYFTLSHEDSKEAIQNYFNEMIIFVVCFSCLLLFCYLHIYYFVIGRKIIILTGVVNILKMIPRLN